MCCPGCSSGNGRRSAGWASPAEGIAYICMSSCFTCTPLRLKQYARKRKKSIAAGALANSYPEAGKLRTTEYRIYRGRLERILLLRPFRQQTLRGITISAPIGCLQSPRKPQPPFATPAHVFPGGTSLHSSPLPSLLLTPHRLDGVLAWNHAVNR